MARQQSDRIRQAVLTEVFWRSNSPVRRVAQAFAVTPQAVQHHVRSLVKDGLLLAIGARRYRHYKLVVQTDVEKEFELAAGVTEDRVWEELVRPQLATLSAKEQDICHYGLTEMVNNAIDHSGGRRMKVQVQRTAVSVAMVVSDDGVGMFQKIADALGLVDPRQSLLELGKGKFTTDPARHTGEGIFFTSRSFDRFRIRSSDLVFLHSLRSDAWLVEASQKDFKGTRVTMGLVTPSDRDLGDVFKKFSSGPDEHRFSKTHVPLKLATYGDEGLVSRSSAKRVLTRINRFDEVMLDFAGVRSVGQAFADEIFRVFANQHPRIRMIAINANEQVTMMIRRAEAARRESGDA